MLTASNMHVIVVLVFLDLFNLVHYDYLLRVCSMRFLQCISCNTWGRLARKASKIRFSLLTWDLD